MTTNPTLEILLNRKSVRAYEDRPIPEDVKQQIIHAAMRAPTAGNMMLYSIIEVTDPFIKEKLAESCDHQPFIARAPLVLLFLADWQRWYDYFELSGAEELCRRRGEPMHTPQEADLLLACCDALIAAQTAVIAAESLGIGSCYIGDIMERYEFHRDLFHLPRYVFPICLLCFGYPTQQQRERRPTERFAQEFIHFENQYKRLGPDEFAHMFAHMEKHMRRDPSLPAPYENIGQMMYLRKFAADFSIEMRRSVRAALSRWLER